MTKQFINERTNYIILIGWSKSSKQNKVDICNSKNSFLRYFEGEGKPIFKLIWTKYQ